MTQNKQSLISGENNQLLYGVIGVVIGGLIVWLFSVNAVNNNMTGMMQMMGMRSQNMVGNSQDNKFGMMGNIDEHFIEQMIPHHDGAIAMAIQAQEKATHPEIKTLANNIITSQSGEINQMKQWYRSWFEKEVEENESAGMGMGRGMMRGGMMGDESDIEELENAADFDKAFIEEMIPHHQMAVMMANMLKGGTQRPEMKQLADDIITSQTTEIDQMRQWYKDWGYE